LKLFLSSIRMSPPFPPQPVGFTTLPPSESSLPSLISFFLPLSSTFSPPVSVVPPLQFYGRVSASSTWSQSLVLAPNATICGGVAILPPLETPTFIFQSRDLSYMSPVIPSLFPRGKVPPQNRPSPFYGDPRSGPVIPAVGIPFSLLVVGCLFSVSLPPFHGRLCTLLGPLIQKTDRRVSRNSVLPFLLFFSPRLWLSCPSLLGNSRPEDSFRLERHGCQNRFLRLLLMGDFPQSQRRT